MFPIVARSVKLCRQYVRALDQLIASSTATNSVVPAVYEVKATERLDSVVRLQSQFQKQTLFTTEMLPL